MNFNLITQNDLQFFRQLIGENLVFTDAESLEKYAHDETEDLKFPPEVILKPSSPEQIAGILKYCNEKKIAVTPRAAGTGLSGGALPVHAGVILSIEKLNHILGIDERNHQVTVEPGVITHVLQEAVKEKGLFYPPDPASKGSCFIGGNVAENSGGPKAVKYGVVKDYVLNLEVVLPTGEIIWTGANVLKNATGYNLTQLIVGSEGTLGIVTKIVLRLIPHPQFDLLMLVPFRSAVEACEAVNTIFMAGITPSAMEFMERDAIDWTMQFVAGAQNFMPLHEKDIAAHLLIEVDGNNIEQLMNDMETITVLLQHFDTGEILFADSSDQKQELWKLRRSVAEAVKHHSVYKEEDTVVPRAELPKLLGGVKEIGAKYGFQSVCYGHVGDGNLHVNIIKGNLSDDDWKTKLPLGIREIFQLCFSLGGTISGEHGIGWVQKPYMDVVFNETQLGLMKKIKKVFDPNGILNPGKIF
ncbi:MAG TPA: FAD-linked oxidase C-terminal domain-containing protein [Chitinophagales bacterium]|nr:FAD-linked oxidase C-terminal domain-containing protein [Chitinophagales bacterium]